MQNKVVLITGGSKGIGKAIALAFANTQAKLVLCARGIEGLEKTKKEIECLTQSNVLIIPADLTQKADAEKVIDQTRTTFGTLNILINNLGGATRFGHFLELEEQDWDDSFRLNLLSMVHITKEALTILKQSKDPRIINISSISGIEPGFSNPHYNVMKAATINFTKCLANSLSQDQILVNAICPGPIFSDSLEDNIQQNAKKGLVDLETFRRDFLNKELEKIPLKRLGSGEDVAAIALFLASDAASWITGSCFHTNGGKMRSI